MSKAPADSVGPPPAEPEALLRLLERGDPGRFRLAVLIVHDEAEREALSRWLEGEAHTRGLTSTRQDLSHSVGGNPWIWLRERLGPTTPNLLLLHGLEGHTGAPGEAGPNLVRALNIQRDLFPRDLPGLWVIFATPFVAHRLEQEAPDLADFATLWGHVRPSAAEPTPVPVAPAAGPGAPMRIRFTRLSPTDTDPRLLVDRAEDAASLREELEAWLDQQPLGQRGQLLAVVGEKGVGKSILTRHVLTALREQHPTHPLVLEVDARGRRSWREVLLGVTQDLVDRLDGLPGSRPAPPPYALPAARVLRALAGLDAATKLVELGELTRGALHEGAVDGATELRSALMRELGLDLYNLDQPLHQGTVRVDEDRLSRAVCALLRDLHKDGQRAVVFVDNLDELDHRYTTEADQRAVRQEVEGILKLREAPITLLLNMRTYFAGVLGRTADNTWSLDTLGPEHLLRVLERRLEEEEDSVRVTLKSPEVWQEVEWMARRCVTPYSFLQLLRYCAGVGLSTATREAALKRTYRRLFPNVDWEDLLRIARAFTLPPRHRSVDTLRAECEPWLALEAMRDQLVLPVDFWSGDRLVLDPLLRPLADL